MAYTLTCYGESDVKLRDIRVSSITQWKGLQEIITEIHGGPVCIRVLRLRIDGSVEKRSCKHGVLRALAQSFAGSIALPTDRDS